jgi:hypothetical protein
MPDPQPPDPVVPPLAPTVPGPSRLPLILAGTAASVGLALATQGLWWEAAGPLVVAVLLAEVMRRGVWR